MKTLSINKTEKISYYGPIQIDGPAGEAGLRRVKIGWREGYFSNKKKSMEIPAIYSRVYDFNKEGVALVKKDKESFLINTKGEKIGAFQYYGGFSEGLGIVGNEGKYGFIDKDGNIAIEMKFSFLKKFQFGYAIASVEQNLFGIIGKDGNWVIEPQFKNIHILKGGSAFVKTEKCWRRIIVSNDEKNGTFADEIKFSTLSKIKNKNFFSAKFEDEDKFYRINEKSQIIVTEQNKNGYSIIKDRNKKKCHGIINSDGLIVVECENTWKEIQGMLKYLTE